MMQSIHRLQTVTKLLKMKEIVCYQVETKNPLKSRVKTTQNILRFPKEKIFRQHEQKRERDSMVMEQINVGPLI